MTYLIIVFCEDHAVVSKETQVIAKRDLIHSQKNPYYQ